MPVPIITNPYSNDNLLTAYVNELFSVRFPVANTPTQIYVTGSWIGWSWRWHADTQEIELYITPKRLLSVMLTIDEDTDLPVTDADANRIPLAGTTGIRMEAVNADGADIEMVPFVFIHRAPIIADIPPQEFTRGQTEVDYNKLTIPPV